MPKQQSVIAEDGVAITVWVFTPPAKPQGVVVIAAAMGVTQKFYRDFAEWVSAQGYIALTFDYRGMGESAPAKLSHYQATIRDWAEKDCPAVLSHARSLCDNTPLFWVGHSLGGQIMGLIPNANLITKAVTVASGNGYWLLTAKWNKLGSLWLWWVVLPLVSVFCSYFPGRKLKIIGDLPLGAIQQWRRWCLSKNYLLDDVEPHVQECYSNIKTPLTFYALADDEMLSYAAIKSVHDFYSSAPRHLELIHPQDNNVNRIGHLGFFKRRIGEQLWPTYILPQLVN